MKKCIPAFAALIFLFTVCAPRAAAGFELPESVSITAEAAFFVNLDTGIVVYEKNADEARSVASLTKLMTALLLIENVSDLSGTRIEAVRDLYVPPITGGGASHADIRPGETVSALDMLYAMMLPSGNEAAECVGYYLGHGNLDNFFALMNARAADLGCANTHFASTNGLQEMDEGNYSCARDLARIAEACWKHDIFRSVVGERTHQMPAAEKHAEPYTIQSTNRMLNPSASVYRGYIKGMKTGSTEAAGRCFVSAAVNERGEAYIGVVLGTPYDVPPDEYAYSFYDTAALYDWIFESFSVRPSIDTGSPVTEVGVNYSAGADTLMLYPASDLRTVLPIEEGESALEKTFDVPERVDAPIAMGDKLGTVTLSLNGSVIGTVDLIAGQDVARSELLYVLSRVQAFFQSTYFRVVCVVTVLYIACYGALTFFLHRRAARARRAAGRGQTPAGGPRAGARTPPGEARRDRPSSNGAPDFDPDGASRF